MKVRNSRILDTNSFVRLIIEDIPSQVEEVENVLRRGRNKQLNLLIGVYTITELNLVLKHIYNLGKQDRLKALQKILSLPINFFDKSDKEISYLALDYFDKYKLDLEDCYNLSYSKIRDYELFTFDTELKKVAKIEGVQRMP